MLWEHAMNEFTTVWSFPLSVTTPFCPPTHPVPMVTVAPPPSPTLANLTVTRGAGGGWTKGWRLTESSTDWKCKTICLPPNLVNYHLAQPSLPPLQTLCALMRAVYLKRSSDTSFDVIDILIGFEAAECQMRVRGLLSAWRTQCCRLILYLLYFRVCICLSAHLFTLLQICKVTYLPKSP